MKRYNPRCRECGAGMYPVMKHSIAKGECKTTDFRYFKCPVCGLEEK